jgi:DNA-binding MarR family transcriptional regulator
VQTSKELEMATQTRAPARPAVRPTADAAEEVTRLADEVARLTRTSHLMRQHIAAKAPEGVEWSAYVLLIHLVKGGPMRSSDLAAAACVDPSTISRQVAQLVKHGLVERQADPVDGRASLLVATEPGNAVYARVRRVRERAFARMVEGWSTTDVRRLATLLHALNESFTDHRTDVLGIVSKALTEETA